MINQPKGLTPANLRFQFNKYITRDFTCVWGFQVNFTLESSLWDIPTLYKPPFATNVNLLKYLLRLILRKNSRFNYPVF